MPDREEGTMHAIYYQLIIIITRFDLFGTHIIIDIH